MSNANADLFTVIPQSFKGIQPPPIASNHSHCSESSPTPYNTGTMGGSTTFSSTPLHRGPCIYEDRGAHRLICKICASVRAGHSDVKPTTWQDIDLDNMLRRKREEGEKDRKAKEDMGEQMWIRHGYDEEQKRRKKREERRQKERDPLKKTHALHMQDLPATYPTPTATSNNRPRKPFGAKTDIGPQGYQKPNMGRGIAGLPHDIFSSASQAAMPFPPNASRVTTSKTPLMKQLSERNPLPGRH